ncbi:MAG: hypothetical protein IIT98_04575, partial [Kiritimatiellae bacterium]|nr:hypothetical protein [Kiritimatiellia bacterium]
MMPSFWSLNHSSRSLISGSVGSTYLRSAGGYDLFVPLMIVSVASYLTINTFEPHSIYAMRLARKGELITHDKDQAILTIINLKSQIETDYKQVSPEMDLGQLVKVITHAHRNIFPVTDHHGKFLGVVT